MQVFKTALRIFFKHPVYILVYVFWLTFMGVFIGVSNVGAPASDFIEARPEVAVIDRDNSVFSQGFTAFLGGHATLVNVEDSRQAMQDASAQNMAQYMVLIPEGFAESFMNAAQENGETPRLETVVSYESITANMMNGLVDEYLNTSRVYISSGTATTQIEAISLTNSDMNHSATARMIQLGESAPVSQQWILYMTFSGYTIMLSIIVCVGVVMTSFNRTDIRRRNLTSPISSLSMNLQVAGAAVVIALLSWVWVSILGLIVFGQSLTGVTPNIVGLAILSLLAFSTVPLAIGFLIGQLSTSPLVMNAAANIIGLVLSFLGGIWVSLTFLSEAVVTIAHFTPTFYYGDAINRAVNLHDFSCSSLVPIFSNIAIMLLFSAAIFAIALAAGRLRVQSSDAGGNAAAERTWN